MFTYEKVFNRYHKIDYLAHIGGILDISLDNSFFDIFFEQLKLCVPSKNSKRIFSISKLSKQYELVLLTNYFKESQLNRLYKRGIGSFFSECYGEELIKSNEEIDLKACGAHLPNECVMSGDDLYLDVEIVIIMVVQKN